MKKNIIPTVKQESQPYNRFTFHTNFDIHESVEKEIQKLTGVVNALSIIRYQLEISVGDLFDKKPIARKVRRILLKYANVNK